MEDAFKIIIVYRNIFHLFILFTFRDAYSINFDNYLNSFDDSFLEWKELITHGSAPEARWGHTGIIFSNKLFIFG